MTFSIQKHLRSGNEYGNTSLFRNTTSIRYIPKYHAKYNTFLTVRIRTLGLTMHIVSTVGSA